MKLKLKSLRFTAPSSEIHKSDRSTKQPEIHHYGCVSKSFYFQPKKGRTMRDVPHYKLCSFFTSFKTPLTPLRFKHFVDLLTEQEAFCTAARLDKMRHRSEETMSNIPLKSQYYINFMSKCHYEICICFNMGLIPLLLNNTKKNCITCGEGHP